jgi:hypothetical protein
MTSGSHRPLLVVAFLLLLALAYGQLGPPAGTATLEVATSPRTPARLYLFKNDAPFRFSPVDAVLPIQSDLFYRERLFTANASPSVLEIVARDQYHTILLKGAARFHLPPGKYRLEAFRGFFYVPARVEFELAAGEERRVSLPLKPWPGVDPAQWISGDDHIHLMRDRTEDGIFLSWLEAEDLTVGNFLELQRQTHAGVQYAHGAAGQARRGGYVIRPGQESRNQYWGHVNLLGASELIHPLSTGLEYANTSAADPWPALWFARGRRLGAIVGHAHFFPQPQQSTIYMDAALGNLDFVEVLQFGALRDELWYELWNAGLRVTGVAGSDFPVPLARRNPWPRWLPLLGPERTLVKASPAENSFDMWASAIREGRVAVSNGPVIELTVDRASNIARATAAFYQPLDSLEIVRDGSVVASAKGDDTRTELSVEVAVHQTDCCWIAARARGRSGDVALHAHTNPQWLLDKPPPERLRSAREKIAARWESQLDQFRRAGIAFSTPARGREFFEAADRALATLRGLQ